MEGQWFAVLYEVITRLGKLRGGKPGQVYSDARVALVALWAALHDRPIAWACQMDNWQGHCPWLTLPSQPTVSRRLRTVGVGLLLTQAFAELNDHLPTGLFKLIDAHPAPVGGASKDREARAGWGAGHLTKGYKIHEIHSGSGHIDAWTLSPMRDKEQTLALQLIPRLSGGGYLVGDNQYDSNRLYRLAGQHNFQLIAPPRPQAQGLGHRRHAAERLRSLALWENPLACCGQPRSMGQAMVHARKEIERHFAHQSAFVGGLGPLPWWVRTPHRVALWIHCKFLIYLAKMTSKSLHLQAA
jgi:hypothetical protein